MDVRIRLVEEIKDCSLEWYQDRETINLVDGENARLYDEELLKRMYEYLKNAGELYWIEVLEEDDYVPIGDVTLCRDDLPIVIGEKEYRGKGIGRQVLELIKERASVLGYKRLYVKEVYHYNKGSQRLFEKAGFKRSGETEKGISYEYDL